VPVAEEELLVNVITGSKEKLAGADKLISVVTVRAAVKVLEAVKVWAKRLIGSLASQPSSIKIINNPMNPKRKNNLKAFIVHF
jgi:hypothetical protein